MQAIVPAVVSRSHDHNQARLPGDLHRLPERILHVAFKHIAAERQIDHANVVGVLQSDSALNGRNHLCVRAAAVRIEHAEIHQIRAGGHSEDGGC